MKIFIFILMSIFLIEKRNCYLKPSQYVNSENSKCTDGSEWSKKLNSCIKCPEGYNLFKGDCLRFSVEPKTWNDAKKDCESINGNLLSIQTLEIFQYLNDLHINFEKLDENLLVGAFTKNLPFNWFWLNDQQIPSYGLIWDNEKFEPANYGGNNLKIGTGCAVATKKGLRDVNCYEDKYNYICQKDGVKFKNEMANSYESENNNCAYDQDCTNGKQCINLVCSCPSNNYWSKTQNKCIKCPKYFSPFEENCYFISEIPLSWELSNRYCKRLNSELLTVETNDIFNIPKFMEHFNLNEHYYIGGVVNNGSAFWINGKPIPPKERMWATNSVNMDQSNTCVEAYTFGINNIECSKSLNFICQKESTYKNIIPDNLPSYPCRNTRFKILNNYSLDWDLEIIYKENTGKLQFINNINGLKSSSRIAFSIKNKFNKEQFLEIKNLDDFKNTNQKISFEIDFNAVLENGVVLKDCFNLVIYYGNLLENVNDDVFKQNPNQYSIFANSIIVCPDTCGKTPDENCKYDSVIVNFLVSRYLNKIKYYDIQKLKIIIEKIIRDIFNAQNNYFEMIHFNRIAIKNKDSKFVCEKNKMTLEIIIELNIRLKNIEINSENYIKDLIINTFKNELTTINVDMKKKDYCKKTTKPSTSPSTRPYSPSTRPYSPSTRPYSPSTRPYSPSTRPYSPTTRPYSPSTRPLSPSTKSRSPSTTIKARYYYIK